MPAWFVPAAMGAASLLGSWLSSRGRQPLDPREFERWFGAQAVAERTRALYDTIRWSPEANYALSRAAAAGQLAGQRVRANLSRAGLASSGVGAVAGATSREFGTLAKLGVEANLWGEAFRGATAINAQGASLWGASQLQYQQTPTWDQILGSGLLSAGQTYFQSKMAKLPPAGTTDATTAATTIAPAASIQSTAVRTAAMNRLTPQAAPGTGYLRDLWSEAWRTS